MTARPDPLRRLRQGKENQHLLCHTGPAYDERPLPARLRTQDRLPDRAAALLAIVGAVNVPIIYYSVQWWNTLHQGASVSLTRAPSMAATMLTGMLLMALACWLYSIAAAMVRVRCLILEREHLERERE